MAFVKVECKDCAFWVMKPNGRSIMYGFCHFDPPQHTGGVGQNETEPQAHYGFRITKANDWCSHGTKK